MTNNKYNRQENYDIPVPGQFGDVLEPDIVRPSNTKIVSVIMIAVFVIGYAVLAGTQNSLFPFKAKRNDSNAYKYVVTTQENELTNIYNDPNGLYSIKYDNSLYIDLSQEPNLLLKSYEDLADPSRSNSSILIGQVSDDNDDATNIGTQNDSSSIITIDNEKVLIKKYSISYDNYIVYYAQVTLKKDNKTFNILLSADSEQRIDELQKVIETFDIL